MMFDSSGHMRSCAVWKSFNQLSSWWLLCKRYAYTLIRVSRHYYVIRMFLLCLCIFVSNKAFWSWKFKKCPNKKEKSVQCVLNREIFYLISLLRDYAWFQGNVSLTTGNDPEHLTHWGRLTHICVNKLTIIDSDNGLSTATAPSHYLNQCSHIFN